MTARSKLLEKIINKIEKIPNEHLDSILIYLENFEQLNGDKRKILSFAGSWKNMDEDLFSDLTKNLHTNRVNETSK